MNVFLRLGFAVKSMASVGNGFPDLIVAKGRRTFLVEVKDGKKSPSERRLTPKEQAFHQIWPGEKHIVETVEQAIAVANPIT